MLPMAATQKVSASLDARELRWLKGHARRSRLSVSALLSDAIRRYREETARREAEAAFLATFSEDERPTPEETEEIRAEWRG